MELIQGLTLGAGLFGAYKGHQSQERILEALDDQTGVMKEKLNLARGRAAGGRGASDGIRGTQVDETV